MTDKNSGTIPPWLRILLGLGSLGSGTIGYFAIMRPNTPEVGGVAFVALAGVLAVLGSIGRVPQKVTAGSVGVEFGPAEKLVKAAERLSPESRIELADGLSEDPEVSPAFRLASDAIRSAAAFEQLIVETLSGMGWLRALDRGSRRDDTGFDAVIEIGGKRYGVEVKAVRSGTLPLAWLHQARTLAKTNSLDGAVVIVPDGTRPQKAIKIDDVWIVEAGEIPRLAELLR